MSTDDRKPPFLVHYNHGGKTYGFTMGAESWDDAQDRLRSIGFNGRVVGSDVAQIPVNSVTMPLVALWASITCWWRNLWGRRS